jgi:hypothetical protein
VKNVGYIIIDEEKLKQKVALWNNSSYKDKVMADVYHARADYAHMLAALQQEEKRIDEDIRILQLKKGDIRALMEYAK